MSLSQRVTGYIQFKDRNSITACRLEDRLEDTSENSHCKKKISHLSGPPPHPDLKLKLLTFLCHLLSHPALLTLTSQRTNIQPSYWSTGWLTWKRPDTWNWMDVCTVFEEGYLLLTLRNIFCLSRTLYTHTPPHTHRGTDRCGINPPITSGLTSLTPT